MSLTKALQGAVLYAVGVVMYGVVFLYPLASLLEILLSIILLTVALIFVSNFVPLLHKWFDFALIVNFLLLLPVMLYLIFNGTDTFVFLKYVYISLIVSILTNLPAYLLIKAGLFHTNGEFLPLATGILTVRLMAWAGLSSLLATLIYWLYQSIVF